MMPPLKPGHAAQWKGGAGNKMNGHSLYIFTVKPGLLQDLLMNCAKIGPQEKDYGD
jgi:hypothetical protein